MVRPLTVPDSERCEVICPKPKGGGPPRRCPYRAKHEHNGRRLCGIHLKEAIRDENVPDLLPCSVCGKRLPHEHFRRNATLKHRAGRMHECKACVSSLRRLKRRANGQKARPPSRRTRPGYLLCLGYTGSDYSQGPHEVAEDQFRLMKKAPNRHARRTLCRKCDNAYHRDIYHRKKRDLGALDRIEKQRRAFAERRRERKRQEQREKKAWLRRTLDRLIADGWTLGTLARAIPANREHVGRWLRGDVEYLTRRTEQKVAEFSIMVAQGHVSPDLFRRNRRQTPDRSR